MSERIESTSERRNSPLRKIQNATTGPIVNFLYSLGVSADNVTDLGEFGTMIGSAIAASRDPQNPKSYKEKSIISGVILLVAQASDAIDGPLARKEGKVGPAGEIKDALADRTGELAMAKARITSAQKRNDTIGAFAATVNGLTNTLSSLAKAYAESKGVIVTESGQGILGVLGTRVPRSILAIIATAFPRIKGFPFQTAVDLAVAGSNLITARNRMKLANKKKATLPQEVRDDALQRLITLGIFQIKAIGTIATTASKKIK